MSEKHIMLVVLAENQSERLARCLKSIQHQEIPAEAKISLIVAGGDTAVIEAALTEVDLTAQMLESSSTGTNTQADLLAAVAEQIPETADWVWALSSNDWLHSKTAIATAIDAAWSEDTLSGSVGLVHLCAADKSLDTGEMFVNTLSDLCSAFGFTEMLGNISSLMMQRYIFQIAFGRHFRTALDASVEDADAEGAGGKTWLPAKFVFLAMHGQPSMLLDHRIVSLHQRDVTREGSTYWCRVVNELEETAFAVGDKTRWAPHFFRVGAMSLWHHILAELQKTLHQMSHTETDDQQNLITAELISNWDALARLAQLIEHEQFERKLQGLVLTGTKLTASMIAGNKDALPQLDRLLEFEIAGAKHYPSTIFSAAYLDALRHAS